LIQWNRARWIKTKFRARVPLTAHKSRYFPRALNLRERFGPFDSVPIGVRRGRPVEPAAGTTIRGQDVAELKLSYKTSACSESRGTVACHLCNTHSKTQCRSRSEVVPLLRVNMPSVIVMMRRRGASRGRPVLAGSLQSLASCGCVRRREVTRRVSRDKGTNP
jgi:hypothetical protein